ncbi:hypothetical protein [Azospirillum agricola]|uniref:hypothetical protein n=1 Tax=Azospirillum agricola TaxID=1720247 RepID=UPI000A0F059F|nr:hypothetical protein [Azospirillum agricola]SMH58421.1 hypothetical protein SAMN02982994_4612 [Azospirillum lipoferum]
MRFRFLAVTALAGSIALSGCAGNNGSDDTGTALLIGAAVVGLGVLAATASDDNDNDYDRRRYASSGRHHHDSYGGRNSYQDRRYANNGRCDDPGYRTSNGGRAERGTDERDCRRYGDGRK